MTTMNVAPGGRPRDAGGAAATSPAEIMAVRLLIEPQMMALAIAAATSADLAEIRRCLDRGQEAASAPTSPASTPETPLKHT